MSMYKQYKKYGTKSKWLLATNAPYGSLRNRKAKLEDALADHRNINSGFIWHSAPRRRAYWRARWLKGHTNESRRLLQNGIKLLEHLISIHGENHVPYL